MVRRLHSTRRPSYGFMMRGASSCDAWMFSGSFIAAFGAGCWHYLFAAAAAVREWRRFCC
jgi:hypothetical protein